MLDYIFFHQQPYQLFQKYLDKNAIPYQTASEFQESINEAGLIISIHESLKPELVVKVEKIYDELMEMNEALVSELEADSEIKNAGITITLSNGDIVLADIEPDLAYKVSRVLSTDELNQFINAIVDAIENPDQRPLCQR